MTTRRDIDMETLTLVGRVDPLDGPRAQAEAATDTEAALRAVLGRLDAPSPSPSRRRRSGLLAAGIGSPAIAEPASRPP